MQRGVLRRFEIAARTTDKVVVRPFLDVATLANSARSRHAARSRAGAVTAEFAATVALLLPVLLIVGFCCYEVATAFMIYNALNHSAHLAAMALSRAYGMDSTYATSQAKQQDLLKAITFSNIVVSPQQFSVRFPTSPSTATWTDKTGNVPMVTVTCTYIGGRYGLPPFPNPDPLRLGSSFPLQAKASAYLEGF